MDVKRANLRVSIIPNSCFTEYSWVNCGLVLGVLEWGVQNIMQDLPWYWYWYWYWYLMCQLGSQLITQTAGRPILYFLVLKVIKDNQRRSRHLASIRASLSTALRVCTWILKGGGIFCQITPSCLMPKISKRILHFTEHTAHKLFKLMLYFCTQHSAKGFVHECTAPVLAQNLCSKISVAFTQVYVHTMSKSWPLTSHQACTVMYAL